MRVKVFWCQESPKVARSLRRYADGPCPNVPGQCSYHNAKSAEIDFVESTPGEYLRLEDKQVEEFKGDPRWPTQCSCGYAFQETDNWQVFLDRVYVRKDTGEEFRHKSMPVGAMWDAWWVSKDGIRSVRRHTGPDGIALCVETPGGMWMVDSRANNCTMPEDDTHYCWVRHGDPRKGTVHVDKQGHTCAAGAGSIAQGDRFHGFLHNGELYEC